MITKIKNGNLYCSRRQALKVLSALFSLVPAYSLAGGSFVNAEENGRRPEEAGKVRADTLAQFMDTIIPGAGGLPHVTNVFVDPFYQFDSYGRFFAQMLNRRARRTFDGRSFYELERHERASLIKNNLTKHGLYAKLTMGAIFISQIYIYSGLYGGAGCYLIDYPGRFRTKTLSHPNPEGYLPSKLTKEGNPS